MDGVDVCRVQTVVKLRRTRCAQVIARFSNLRCSGAGDRGRRGLTSLASGICE